MRTGKGQIEGSLLDFLLVFFEYVGADHGAMAENMYHFSRKEKK